jgi:hypothetical protein
MAIWAAIAVERRHLGVFVSLGIERLKKGEQLFGPASGLG